MYLFLSLQKNEVIKACDRKLRKGNPIHGKHYEKQVFYFNTQLHVQKLVQHINNSDKNDPYVIELHAEGDPWVVGSKYGEKCDHSPFSLAKWFSEQGFDKEKHFTISLHSCNSATIARGRRGGICFAEIFSIMLSKYGFSQVSVTGYTGYLHSENYFKQSVTDTMESTGKGKHCSLYEAQATYHDGKLIVCPRRTMIQNMRYSMEAAAQYFTDAATAFLDLVILNHMLPKTLTRASPITVEKAPFEAKAEAHQAMLTHTHDAEKTPSDNLSNTSSSYYLPGQAFNHYAALDEIDNASSSSSSSTFSSESESTPRPSQ